MKIPWDNSRLCNIDTFTNEHSERARGAIWKARRLGATNSPVENKMSFFVTPVTGAYYFLSAMPKRPSAEPEALSLKLHASGNGNRPQQRQETSNRTEDIGEFEDAWEDEIEEEEEEEDVVDGDGDGDGELRPVETTFVIV